MLDNIQHSWLPFNPFRDIKLLQEKVNVRVAIHNGNPFDIPVIYIEGTLKHQGTHIGSFRAANQKMLPAGVESVWEIPVKYTTENALFTLQRLMEGSGTVKEPLDIRMTAKARVKGKLISLSWTDQIQFMP